MRRRDAGITLVEVTAAVTVVGIILALLIPAISRGSRLEKIMRCRDHLKTMHAAQLKAPADARFLGSAYWMRLAKSDPPLIQPEFLRCPLVDAPEQLVCHYMGPASNPAELKDKDPLGCDYPQNHSDDGKQGGNVLLKSGEVVTDHTGVWAGAGRQGKCRP